MSRLNISLLFWGAGWVRQRCHVSCITGASNWYWPTVGQGLLSLQQVRVKGECFYFFCFLTFIHFPLSTVFLSFISSTISSISVLPFSGRWHKMTHKGWHVVRTPAQSISYCIEDQKDFLKLSPFTSWHGAMINQSVAWTTHVSNKFPWSQRYLSHWGFAVFAKIWGERIMLSEYIR